MANKKYGKSKILIVFGLIFLMLNAVFSLAADSCVPAPSNLLHWWAGEGDVIDEAGNEVGELKNGATYAAGKVSQAFSFDGDNDYVEMSREDIPSKFSFEAWVKHNDPSNPSKQWLFFKSGVGGLFFDTGGWLKLQLSGPEGTLTFDLPTFDNILSNNEWVHLVLTMNLETQSLKYYINGAQFEPQFLVLGGDPITSVKSSNNPLRIGGSALSGFSWNGLMDEVRTYDKVLVTSEVSKLHNSGTAGMCALEVVCGDGVMKGTEECDDGNTVNTDACTNSCLDNVCGDGIFHTGVEECDDGNTDDTDSCTNSCKEAVCGDGITGPDEECDDGNSLDTDSCTSSCKLAVCGDGITGPDEECDDGNTNDTDSCTNSCKKYVAPEDDGQETNEDGSQDEVSEDSDTTSQEGSQDEGGQPKPDTEFEEGETTEPSEDTEERSSLGMIALIIGLIVAVVVVLYRKGKD